MKWWFAGPIWSQHDPDFDTDGTISVFDNRASGEATAANDYKGRLGGSRIFSVDPATGQTRVLYQSDAQNAFYSPYRGKHQRLPNGNILIAETDGGRAFEVTLEGRLVWEYVNGFDETNVGWVMGATRFPESYAAIADISCN